MEWRTIQGYEQYEVSNEGQVRNKKTGRILKPAKNNRGYLFVRLSKNSKIKNFYIHRLVAIAFIPNPDNLETVNHIDHNKQNNDASNLEWMSRGNNTRDGSQKRVYCVELDQTFDSITEAQKETGIYQSNITVCCQGKKKTAGGYHWKYVDES